jgi:hypothetical protein
MPRRRKARHPSVREPMSAYAFRALPCCECHHAHLSEVLNCITEDPSRMRFEIGDRIF